MTKLRHKRPDGTWCPYKPLPSINGIYICEKCGQSWTLTDISRALDGLTDSFTRLTDIVRSINEQQHSNT